MNVIVTDTGFSDDDWIHGFGHPDSPPEGPEPLHPGLELTADTPPDRLAGLMNGAAIIRVRFDQFSDGRGFTLARQLRRLGYRGRLRAVGHVLADQYAMARRSGFDEVEISPELAARQTADQWRLRADWQAHDYQSRLRG